jgi:hypothetical protein
MDDTVLIDQAIIRIIKSIHQGAKRTARITTSAVTKELKGQRYLKDVAPGRYSIDPTRFWAIPRKLWEDRVNQSTYQVDFKKSRLKLVS